MRGEEARTDENQPDGDIQRGRKKDRGAYGCTMCEIGFVKDRRHI